MRQGFGRRVVVAAVTVVFTMVVAACGSTGGSSMFKAKPGQSTTTAAAASAKGTASAAGHGVAVASSKGCSSKAPVKPGRTQTTITSGGLSRVYVLYVPKHYVPGKPTPLVFNFHGLTSPIEGEELISGFATKADAVTTLEVLPLGKAAGIPAWNITKYPKWPDDKLFVSDLLTSLENRLCVNTRRVYAMGLSNGAQMTSFVACNLADRIAAFAMLSGLLDLQGQCHPSRPVDIIVFHGTADQFLPFTGGVGTGANTLKLDKPTIAGVAEMLPLLKPIPEVFTSWAKRDGCHGMPTETQVTPHVLLRAYGPKCKGVELKLYIVDGGGHTWPGSTGSAAVSSVVGATNMEISANDLIWSFFVKHPLPA